MKKPKHSRNRSYATGNASASPVLIITRAEEALTELSRLQRKWRAGHDRKILSQALKGLTNVCDSWTIIQQYYSEIDDYLLSEITLVLNRLEGVITAQRTATWADISVMFEYIMTLFASLRPIYPEIKSRLMSA